MRTLILAFLLVTISLCLHAQHHGAAPGGTTFGKPVDATQNMPAAKLEAFMGKKIRISTTLTCKVLKVTKGGWFDVDAGNGKVMHAHFKEQGIDLPASIRGHDIIMEGIAAKQITPDDGQHYAGNAGSGQRPHQQAAKPEITFEVTGLKVL